MQQVRAGEFTFTRTERVVFGRPAHEAIAEQAARLGAARVFLVASTSLATNSPAIATIEQALGPRHAGSFHGIAPHAPRSGIVGAALAARAAGADLLVSVGGGSVTDATKILALALKHGVQTVDDFEPLRVRVDLQGKAQTPNIAGPDIPVICVPTTLSGGEFNPRSGATDEAKNHKQGYFHPGMAPVAVILDPELALHTPDWVWFSTGVRAVDHAVETLGSHQSHSFADNLAASALALLCEGLSRTRANPADLGARLQCQLGAWQAMAAVIGGVPMGASHAIGHVLGGTCGVPHGYTSCVLLPHVLRWNMPANADRQRRVLAVLRQSRSPVEAMLRQSRSQVEDMPGQGHDTAADAVGAFIHSLGMPRTLAEVGVLPDRFDQVARLVMHDLWLRTNPRRIDTPADVLEILHMAA